MRSAARFLFVSWLALVPASAATAEGNLASKPTRLPPLVLGDDLSFSIKEYELETGKYYRWRIESAGGEEFRIEAPELFRNSWIDQIVVNDIEVHAFGAIYGIEFDDAGIADIWFVPIRQGDFEFYAAEFQERGMRGKFIVR